MNTPCDAPGCRRGILALAEGWGNPCPHCKGLGVYSFAALCRLLETDESVMRRFLKSDSRPRVQTSQRILERVMKILEPEVCEKQLRLHGS